MDRLKPKVWRYRINNTWETVWDQNINWSCVRCPACREKLGDIFAEDNRFTHSFGITSKPYYYHTHNCGKDGILSRPLLRAYF